MSEQSKRGRPRNAEADRELLDAARILLRETGYAAFNVDVIAERTGIAKTTIYRRWPSKAALVAAAIAPLDRDAVDPRTLIEETAELIAMLVPLEGDAIEVIRAILEPRRALLLEWGRDADDVDAELGKLVVRGILS